MDKARQCLALSSGSGGSLLRDVDIAGDDATALIGVLG
jgi:hypothetical protein